MEEADAIAGGCMEMVWRQATEEMEAPEWRQSQNLAWDPSSPHPRPVGWGAQGQERGRKYEERD